MNWIVGTNFSNELSGDGGFDDPDVFVLKNVQDLFDVCSVRHCETGDLTEKAILEPVFVFLHLDVDASEFLSIRFSVVNVHERRSFGHPVRAIAVDVTTKDVLIS